MQPNEPEPVLPASPAVVSRVAADGNARRVTLTLVTGLVAGLVAWLAGEACIDLIKPPRHPMESRGIILHVTFPREEARADAKNAGLAFVALGSALGAGLGAAGGLARRSGRAALLAGLFGLVVGAVAAAGTSLALLPAYNTYKAGHPDEALQDLLYPLLIHVGVWSAVGAAAGLAFGLGLGERQRLPVIVQAALVGAALGAVAYELIGALGFPGAGTARFVSTTWGTRLFARLAVTVLTALGAGLAVREPRTRPVSPADFNAAV
jgi:hypothetical protein